MGIGPHMHANSVVCHKSSITTSKYHYGDLLSAKQSPHKNGILNS